MKIAIACPGCGNRFTIDHLAADREIERLKKEVSGLRAKVAAMEEMKRYGGGGLDGSDLLRRMGLGL